MNIAPYIFAVILFLIGIVLLMGKADKLLANNRFLFSEDIEDPSTIKNVRNTSRLLGVLLIIAGIIQTVIGILNTNQVKFFGSVGIIILVIIFLFYLNHLRKNR